MCQSTIPHSTKVFYSVLEINIPTRLGQLCDAIDPKCNKTTHIIKHFKSNEADAADQKV